MSYINEIPSNVFFAAMAKDISEMAKHESNVFIFQKAESALFTLTDEKDNINLRLNFTVKTLEDAKNMEQIVRGLIAMAHMQKEDIPVDVKLPDDLIIQTDKNRDRMGFTYPVEYIIQLIAKKGKFPPFSFKGGFSPLS